MAADIFFRSRRAAVVTCNAAVSCDQPLASQAGIDILKNGGNAADAAVAMAAALNVTQPNSTGLGGDAFCLFYDAKTKKVHGINGSGRSPSGLTLDKVLADGFSVDRPVPATHGHAVTVPGAAAAWVDTVNMFGSGKVSLASILKPAINIAEQGFPVTEIASYFWKRGEHLLKTKDNVYGHGMLINGKAPEYGQIFKNPDLAATLKELSAKGKPGFYEGRAANAIAAIVQRHGGVMTSQDLASHVTTFDEQISTTYKGVRLWEIPPNGQGIVALIALNILENFDIASMEHNSAEYIHVLAEALKLSFADAVQYVADPSMVKVPVDQMLNKDRAGSRAKHIDLDRAQNHQPDTLDYPNGKDTTYLSVVDEEGNACSFINSNFHGFGSGIVPEGCGFTLQNRGCGFSLKSGHLNVVAPNKRPYHTIIPAMLTSADSGDLLCCYGVMGGYMQPQGHVQVLMNMLEYGMDPQSAIDAPRICVGSGYQTGSGLMIEDGIADDVISILQAKGHDIAKQTGHDRACFGRGHVITNGAWWRKHEPHYRDLTGRVLWTGTDPRCDGSGIGY